MDTGIAAQLAQEIDMVQIGILNSIIVHID